MPVHLEKLPDQPIIVGTYTGIVRCRDVMTATRDALELLLADAGANADVTTMRKYYLVDARTLDMEISELGCIVDYELKGLPGTFTDPYAFAVFVGTNLVIRAFQKLMAQKGVEADELAIYLRMEDAYAAIQAHIRSH